MYKRFVINENAENILGFVANEIKLALSSAMTDEYKTTMLDFCFKTSDELFTFLDHIGSKHTGVVKDTAKRFDYSLTSGAISNLLQTYSIHMISGGGRAFTPNCYDKLLDLGVSRISFNSVALHSFRWMLYRPTEYRLENVIGDNGREEYETNVRKLQQVMLPYDIRVVMPQQLDAIFSTVLERIQSRPWDCNIVIPLIVPHISESEKLVVTSESSIQSINDVIDWYMNKLCDIFTKRINAVADIPFPISLIYDNRNCSVHITV